MKVEYDNNIFDSNEEVDFYHWLVEAKQLGYIDSFVYHPQSWVLSEKKTQIATVGKKTKTKHLLHPHTYTCDFVFLLGKDPDCNLIEEFPKAKIISNNCDDIGYVYVDVKGAFVGKYNNSAITFLINQKWVYEKYGEFVNKVVPKTFFKNTWLPENSAYGKRGNKLKKWDGYSLYIE